MLHVQIARTVAHDRKDTTSFIEYILIDSCFSPMYLDQQTFLFKDLCFPDLLQIAVHMYS